MSDWRDCLAQHLSAYYADITADEISLWTTVIAVQSDIFRQTLSVTSIKMAFELRKQLFLQLNCPMDLSRLIPSNKPEHINPMGHPVSGQHK